MPNFAELGIYALALIGFVTVISKFSLKLKSFKFNPKVAKYALVTGASEGIGKDFCLELARKGHDIILMARSVQKLETVAKECQELGAKTLVIPFDFYKATSKQWIALQKQLDDKDIGVLINNVGVSHEFPVSFLDESAERCEMITAVNIDSILKITRIVLPQMDQKHLYGSGQNVSPLADLGVAEEVKQYNVHVEHSNTLLVQTAMSKIRKPSFFVPSPEQFSRKALARCGSGYDSTLYPAHEIIDTFANFLPEFFKRNQLSAIHADVRKRALRKQAREAESEKK